MRSVLLIMTAVILAGCGPASRLNYAQRAEIRCAVTGRAAESCMGRVVDDWSPLARACGIRSNIVTVCEDEFERRYELANKKAGAKQRRLLQLPGVPGSNEPSAGL